MKASFMPSTASTRPVRRFLPPLAGNSQPVNGNSAPDSIKPKGDDVTLSELPPPSGPPVKAELAPPTPVAKRSSPPQISATAPLAVLDEPAPAQHPQDKPETLSPMEKMLRDLDDGWRVSSFNREHSDAGWKVREDKHDPKFWVNGVEGREVAFIARDEQGQQVKKRGVIAARPESQSSSSLFQLEGQDGEFNTNHLEALAVKPNEPEPHAAAGKTFRTRFEEAGWEVREPKKDGWNTDFNFTPDKLAGRDVGFVTCDETGREVEHRGVLQHTGKFNSSLFTLEGQEGVFNANKVTDMAARRPQPKAG